MRDRRPIWGTVLLIAVLGFVPAAWAQVTPSLGGLPIDLQALQQAQRQAAQQVAVGGLALEGAIDAETYVVGPGDEFTVAVGGNFSQELRTVVSADGALLIPEVGRFQVAGLTLAAVEQRVAPALRQVYRNVPAELALTQPRRFYVHVSGAVATPGRHLVGPIARVEDAVKAAMDDQNPLHVLRLIERGNTLGDQQRMLPALRNVRIVRTDGTSFTVDLRRYYMTGERDHNPHLQDGDVVVVPPFEDHQNAIHIDGPLLSPGLYDFRAGDTVESLLAVAAGPDALPGLGPVRLVRRDGSSISVRLNPDGAETPLQPGDRLLVEPFAPDAGFVVVDGRVMFPGEYRVEVGVTTVRQLIEMAGGLRRDALANAAYLERRGSKRPGLAGDDAVARELAGVSSASDVPIPQLAVELRIQEEAFRRLRLADLDFASRQYLLGELRRTPRVPLALVADNADWGVTLRDRDRVVVPDDVGGIYVFGQVARSGFVPYEQGLSVRAYVDRAGGATSAATDVYVRRAGSELILRAADAGAIMPGDAVFVDRRPVSDSVADEQLRMQERALRAQHRQQWIQAGAAILGTATAIITAFIFTR